VPAFTGEQVPLGWPVFARVQASQVPSHAVSQHTPSPLQSALTHSPELAQVAPRGSLQNPPLQVCGATQSLSELQLDTHAPLTQAYPTRHVVDTPAGQAPLTSQVAASCTVLGPVHTAGAQVVPAG
jgi:hypothetical protein